MPLPLPTGPIFIVVAGVSGSGKSTIGKNIAAKLDLPFLDGDDLHTKENVKKLSRGQPLTDEDRGPWLLRIRDEAIKASIPNTGTGPYDQPRRPTGLVVACSALKKSYRDVLRGGGGQNSLLTPSRERDVATTRRANNALSAERRRHDPLHSSLPTTFFVHLTGSRDTLYKRMECRKGHFMKTNMLDSQLRALEPPSNDEKSTDVIQVDVDAIADPKAQVDFALSAMTRLTASMSA